MAKLQVWAIVALSVLAIAAVPVASATIPVADSNTGHLVFEAPTESSECGKDLLTQILCHIL